MQSRRASRAAEQGGAFETKPCVIIDAVIARDLADGPGLMARALMELLVLVEERRLRDVVALRASAKEHAIDN